MDRDGQWEYGERASGTVLDSGTLVVIWHECLQRPWPEEGGCLRLVDGDADTVTRDRRVAAARAALHATMRACDGDGGETDDAKDAAEIAWRALEGVCP